MNIDIFTMNNCVPKFVYCIFLFLNVFMKILISISIYYKTPAYIILYKYYLTLHNILISNRR